MSATKLKFLISGAGIAGPCLAYWLSRTRLNAAITIIERSSVPRVTGQSIDIRGPGIEIVKRMNLEEAVRARNTTEEATVILDSSGKPFALFKGGDTFTAEYEILRADLAGLFMETTESLSNVKYVYGDSIKSLDQREKNVNVTFDGGSSATFDLVVAADGGTSRTRDMILDEHITKNSYDFLGQYIAFFSIPSRPTDPKMWQWYNRPKGLCIMLRPHRNPATVGAYLCITTPAHGQQDPAVEAALDKGVEAQKRICHEYLGNLGWEAKRVLEGMDAAEDFYMSRAAQVKLPKWTNGRALVLGDAAHATFGVGTTLAIESAYILAGELSKIQSSEDVPRALERFEEVYRPLYTKSEDGPPFFPQGAFPQTSWALWLRDSLLWFVSKTKLYKLLPADDESGFELPSYDWVDIR
ncbi:FAD/NAD(P)-binding domain-containing protein [Lophium mytilinum]|uniref:FAD/NAD(P)-binding domain-containing protein n=1 Tax=Lophium mytilinum TaxID=390894 RepID=A0A6A6QKW0_9PEZI|nr:FAD/NAD(P)-binding domain-containing protein [Lophium mytilinum]